MRKEYRYILEKGNKKHHCPACSKKRFVQYVDTQTGEKLPSEYGRCDRESKCGYHLNPYNNNYAKSVWETENGNTIDWKPSLANTGQKPKVQKQITFIPDEVFKRTRGGYNKNVFIQNLIKNIDFPFDIKDVEKVIALYHLGTVQNGYRIGANTFPFIDLVGKVRTIQVKQFDESNHTTSTDFLHSMIEKHYLRKNKAIPHWIESYKDNETKVSCLFGEHLLSSHQKNPVALVEAPKTAVYCSLYFGLPEVESDLIWLAVYNLSSLNLNKCKELKGRKVYLFPDLSKDGKTYDLWSNKAKEIEKHLKGSKFHVSDLLEQLAPNEDRIEGKDIADYLIKQDWRLFRKRKPEKSNDEITALETYQHVEETSSEVENESLTKSHIDRSIVKLENYFTNAALPDKPIKLNECSTITDCFSFVESHLQTIRTNCEKKSFLPYLHRLQELKHVLNSI